MVYVRKCDSLDRWSVIDWLTSSRLTRLWLDATDSFTAVDNVLFYWKDLRYFHVQELPCRKNYWPMNCNAFAAAPYSLIPVLAAGACLTQLTVHYWERHGYTVSKGRGPGRRAKMDRRLPSSTCTFEVRFQKVTNDNEPAFAVTYCETGGGDFVLISRISASL